MFNDVFHTAVLSVSFIAIHVISSVCLVYFTAMYQLLRLFSVGLKTV
jgi:hypothetical protein